LLLFFKKEESSFLKKRSKRLLLPAVAPAMALVWLGAGFHVKERIQIQA
jgi:hypothetical protein